MLQRGYVYLVAGSIAIAGGLLVLFGAWRSASRTVVGTSVLTMAAASLTLLATRASE